MKKHVGIRSLAVSFPAEVRTNDYWRNKYPDAVADAEKRTLARLFSASSAGPPTLPFDIEMAPYLADPFRGTVERRILAPGGKSLELELRAAKGAIEAARRSPQEIDAVMVASLLPDTLGVGNAAYLCRELGMSMPAWNIESGCCGTMVGLQSATALVRSGDYESVLVVNSTTYSRVVDDTDSLSWFMADGAGAFVVGEVPAGEGVLGMKVISTQETCNAFIFEMIAGEGGKPRIRLRAGDETAGKLMRDNAEKQLRTCADGAMAAAGVKLDDVKFFVFNTPTAWFARFGARSLGVDPERTISMYGTYGNIATALTTANLYHAAHSGKIRPGDLVLVYAVGSMSTAGAAVMRWGDVALGPPPSSPSAKAR